MCFRCCNIWRIFWKITVMKFYDAGCFQTYDIKWNDCREREDSGRTATISTLVLPCRNYLWFPEKDFESLLKVPKLSWCNCIFKTLIRFTNNNKSLTDLLLHSPVLLWTPFMNRNSAKGRSSQRGNLGKVCSVRSGSIYKL